MQSFVDRQQDRITGVLSGFDRVLFRGNLQSMSCLFQLDGFLLRQRISYKDFGSVVQAISDRVKARAKAFADENGRPYIPLNSPSADKNAFVQKIIQRENITEGLVCVLGCVEVCSSLHRAPKPGNPDAGPDFRTSAVPARLFLLDRS